MIRVKWNNGIHEIRIFAILQRELGGLNETPALLTALLELLGAIDFQDSDYQNLELYHEVLNCLRTLYSSLREENMGPGHYLRVFSWPSLLRADFVILAKQKCPVALVLLAYYLVFVKLLPGMW